MCEIILYRNNVKNIFINIKERVLVIILFNILFNWFNYVKVMLDSLIKLRQLFSA